MEWISVKDKLPEPGRAVLITENGSTPISAIYKTEYADWDENCNCGGCENYPRLYQNEVTHWMPLPEPPKD